MSFLTLNGWTVPIARGGECGTLEIGDRDRTFNGDTSIDRRAIKRIWRFQSTTVNEMVAEAIRAQVLGRYWVWPFDGDLFASSGVWPSASSGATIRSGLAADGAPVYHAVPGGSTYGAVTKFMPTTGVTRGSVTVDPVRTNILTANQRDSEDGTTGFTAVGGSTVTQDGTHYWQGVKSIKALGGVINRGVQVDAQAAAASTRYVASAYVKINQATGTVRMELYGNVGGVIATADFAIDTTDTVNKPWVRLMVSGVSGASDTAVGFRVKDLGGSITAFYVDGCQVETTSTSITNPTAWVDGVRAGDSLRYATGGNTGYRDVTIACWVLPSPAVTPAGVNFEQTWIHLTTPDGEEIRLYRDDGTNLLYLLVTAWAYDGAVNFNQAKVSTSLNYGFDPILDGRTWRHVAITIRPTPEPGEAKVCLYFDGALVASASPAAVPTLNNLDYVNVGSEVTSGVSFKHATNYGFDELVACDWAAPADQILAWYNLGKGAAGLAAWAPDGIAFPPTPAMWLGGDIVAGGPVRVTGRVEIEPVNPLMVGSWRSNSRRVSFTLEEL